MFDLANQFVQLAQVCRNNKVDFEIKIIINAQKCTTSTFRVPGWKLGRGKFQYNTNGNIFHLYIRDWICIESKTVMLTEGSIMDMSSQQGVDPLPICVLQKSKWWAAYFLTQFLYLQFPDFFTHCNCSKAVNSNQQIFLNIQGSGPAVNTKP